MTLSIVRDSIARYLSRVRTSNPLALDRQLCFALYSASLALTRAYKPLLDPLGLTYPQYLAMLVLWERDGIGVAQIGAQLGLDSATLTPLLKRLEACGLLHRVRDTSDQRRVLLRLSAAGRALKARAQPVPAAIAAATGCDVEELAALTAGLNTLRARILPTTPLAA